MSYVGLARKYRPQTFDEIVGQEETAITLRNAIRSDHVHHAYLFAGGKGVGKTSMARIFAKALNCVQGPTITPCNQCELCQRISSGEDIDVIEIDGASNRGIDEIRNIKENIKYLTSRAHFKIFIIDEVHMLTQAAFNALLKTLEEPPLHVKFIMATTQITSIPDTILSRCQRFTFKNIEIADIIKRLQEIADKEKIEVDDATLEKIALTAGGALRDSLVLFEQLASYTNGKIGAQAVTTLLGNIGERGSKIIDTLEARNPLELLTDLRDFFAHGGDPSQLVEELIHKLRDILVVGAAQNVDKLVEGSTSYRQWVTQHSSKLTPEFLTMAIYQLLEAKNLIHRSLMGRIVLETVLLKLLRTESLWPLGKIEQTLLTLDDKLSKMKMPASSAMPVYVAQVSEPRVVPAAMPASLPEEMESDDEVPPAVLVGMEAFEKLPLATLPATPAKPQTKTTMPPVAPKQLSTTPGKEVFAGEKKKPDQAAKQENAEAVRTAENMPGDSLSPWERFLDALKSKMPRQAELLRVQAKPQIHEQQLVIHLPSLLRVSEKIFANPDYKLFVQEIGLQVFGKKFSLRFAFDDEKSGTPLPPPTRPEDRLKSDPLIKKTLDLFEGRISHVRQIVTVPAAEATPAAEVTPTAVVETPPPAEEDNE
jgi:DNA polymerase III subunit gamma/tau